MNILISSVGTRNKIVQYFKKAMCGKGNIIATDMSKLAPALYEADRYYLVPSIFEEHYIETLLDICCKENIKGIISLIDPELSILAKHCADFSKIGVKVIGSSFEACERALDKYEMFKWLKTHGYNCALSYIDKELFYSDLKKGLIDYPVFVKPIRGSASVEITKAYDRDTIEFLFSHEKNLMIQEFLAGQEIGADVYIDLLNNDVVSIFTKKKVKMRAGETDKAVSFKNTELFELIEKFVIECGFRAQVDIDIFEVNGKYYFSEVNPRFGGGYPHAYESGADHMSLIVNNLAGVANKKTIGDYRDQTIMMKYVELMVI